MENETTKQTIERHDAEIKDLQKFKKRVGTEVREANLRAKEAHVGFVEVSVAQKFYEKNFDKLEKKIVNNTRSLIVLIISIIGGIITIVSYFGGK